MPANLTPEFEKAEQRFREATTDAEKLQALREMLSTIPKHKGTEKMQADIKRRISQLQKASAKKTGKAVDLFHVPKTGAGQVVLIGPPNAGKSSIVAACTNAPVKVADYPYTTSLPTPGMLNYEDVQIQLVDTPPMTADNIPPGLMGTINFADVIAIVIAADNQPAEYLDGILAIFSQRGLVLRTLPRNQLDNLDDVEAGTRKRSAIVLLNKIDLASADAIDKVRAICDGKLDVIPISTLTGEGLDVLAERFWKLLAVIRVYTKEPGKPVDKDRPYTLPVDSTVADLAAEVHRDLPKKMKFARIWGDGRFQGQHVHRTEVLHDKDIVEIHK
ncbi:MAG: TGS domain-containing protein [Planctomycetes bacterium]|nr:TGS domain-containing protein [Planctomycetota bacterium]